MVSRKLLPLIFGALVSTALAEDKPPVAGLIDAHGTHVVLVAGTLSADGRYVAGWTADPKKGKPPVKWNLYGKDDDSFFDNYCDPEGGGAGYTITNFIVDFPSKTIVTKLNFSSPYFDRKGHGGFEMMYGPDGDGHRFVLAKSDNKWDAADLVLVDIKADGATQADLLKPLNAAVAGGLVKQGRKSTKGYAMEYPIFQAPVTGFITGFSDPTTAHVPFSTQLPAGNGGAYAGTVLVQLSAGKDKPVAEIGEVKFMKGDPDPVKDCKELAEADKELNEAYGELRSRLDAKAKAKLMEEQRAWIKDRDNQVGTIQSTMDAQDLRNPEFVKNDLMVTLTRERIDRLHNALMRAH